jgi:hypothetical protein
MKMSYYEFLKQTQTKLWNGCRSVNREIWNALKNGEISHEQAQQELLDHEKTKEYTEQLCNALQEIMNRVKPYTYVEYITYKYRNDNDRSRIIHKRMNSIHSSKPNELNDRYKELQNLIEIYIKLIEKNVEPAEFCKMKSNYFPVLRDRPPNNDEKNTFEKQLENDIEKMKQTE